MFRALFARSQLGRSAQTSRRASGRGAEASPPPPSAQRPWSSRLGDWLGASSWRVSGVDMPSASGRRGRRDAVAAARLDFADALHDVRTPSATLALDRIAVMRSLHELWHCRGDVFDHVSRRHDQAEAGRRLAALDRHFAARSVFARLRDSGSASAHATER
jgi:hypothetical protein